MMRVAILSLLGLVSLTLLSCGGSKITSAPPIPSVAGAWEFIATPSQNPNNCGPSGSDPCQTGIEVAMQEGQTLINGVAEPNGSLSASSTQINFVTIDGATGDASSVGGSCSPTLTPTNSLTGSVSAYGGPFTFSFTENGNAFNVTGTLSGDGKTILNATYTPQSGSSCNQSGSLVGTIVSKLSGTYTGTMCPLASNCSSPNQFSDTVTATLSEGSGNSLSVNLVLSGTDNTSFTLTGPVTGNAFSVQGTFQGQSVTYGGYYEMTYDSLTLAYDIPSVYLANTTNPDLPNYAGTLTVPQTPAARPRP